MQLITNYRLTRLALSVSCLASLGVTPAVAQSTDEANQSYPRLVEQNIKSKLSFISEGDRRLGLGSNGETKSNEAGETTTCSMQCDILEVNPRSKYTRLFPITLF